MADYVQQLRGGTLAASLWAPATWIGPIGCILIDTDIWNIRIQDGSTAGGHLIAGSGTITIPVGTTDGGTGLTGPYSDGQILIGNGTGLTASTLSPGEGIAIGSGAGAVTIGISPPVLTMDGGTGLTGPYTDGQLLIGDSSTGFLDAATITPGAGITIANGNGSITISASASGAPGAPWTIVDVTGAVSSYTVSISSAKTMVVWRVSGASTKTTVIPASSGANNGYDIELKVTQGNGDTHNIVPMSGTVEGSGTLTFTDAAGVLHYAIRMTSDGNFTDWIVT